jgi:hypothetical protein
VKSRRGGGVLVGEIDESKASVLSCIPVVGNVDARDGTARREQFLHTTFFRYKVQTISYLQAPPGFKLFLQSNMHHALIKRISFRHNPMTVNICLGGTGKIEASTPGRCDLSDITTMDASKQKAVQVFTVTHSFCIKRYCRFNWVFVLWTIAKSDVMNHPQIVLPGVL